MATSQLNIIAECSTGVTTAITMCDTQIFLDPWAQDDKPAIKEGYPKMATNFIEQISIQQSICIV
jgi:hypothetical protein